MTDLKLLLTRAYESAVINEARALGWPCTDFGEAADLIPRETFQILRDAFAAQIDALDD